MTAILTAIGIKKLLYMLLLALCAVVMCWSCNGPEIGPMTNDAQSYDVSGNGTLQVTCIDADSVAVAYVHRGSVILHCVP